MKAAQVVVLVLPALRQPLDPTTHVHPCPFPSAALSVAPAALRRRLTAAIHDFQGAAAQYEEVIRHGLDLEAVVKCRQLGVFEPPGLPASAAGTRATLQRLVWRYRCSVEVSGVAGLLKCSYAVANDHTLLRRSVLSLSTAR